MDVAVDHLQPAFRAPCWGNRCTGTFENIGHGCFSFRLSLAGVETSREGLSAHIRSIRLGESRRKRGLAVELPVRVVARIQEHAIGSDLIDQLFDARLVGRRVEGLGSQPHVIAHDIGGWAINPGHLDTHTLPGLVGAPHEGRQPTNARLHHDNLEVGKLAEHAFEDEA